MARPTVYVETSIISYLVGWLHPRNPIVAGNQLLTREWWESRRKGFELFTSGAVIDEALKGDPGRASERLELVSHMTMLDVTSDARQLAALLLRESASLERQNSTRCTSRSPQFTGWSTC